ncbi:5-oxoproline transporter, DUF969 family subunit, partial [Staphylococcus pettenkoferi]|uniref:5-oxoproline transporter, DUF969 family subunit n=1 Tax=Staphylococcus pettenkoferi TaxID=170573 RepID=UPI0011A5465C
HPLLTLFLLTLPILALIQPFPLNKHPSNLIPKVQKLTTARLITFYLILTNLPRLASIPINPHPQFLPPLINPITQTPFPTRYNL